MKELENDPTGDFSAGQAAGEAAKLAETPAHDATLWAEQAAKAADRARESVARANRSIRGQG
jgi:hypothetical protein